ncbi:hypothetical protein [Streptomyces sp. NPDC021562]|uniref:hypothetical protein n=1 Tax=Streptomyces sp. NPDC021562 TaxID=3155121 RepID=UPI00104C41B1
MSDETKTAEAGAATAEDAEITTLNSHATSEPLNVTTLNSHATSEPLNGTVLAADADTTVTPDNSHATDQKA